MAKNHANSVKFGFEEKLWQAADKLRSNMDASEYRTVVLGLIFLKFISDAFHDEHKPPYTGSTDFEDNCEYKKRTTFIIPPKARWDYLEKNTKKEEIGELIDIAMEEIKKANSSLNGVLQTNYSREALDKESLGELIELIGTIGLGEKEVRNIDILGRVFEYFLGQFAIAEGKKGGQFFTPKSIVKLLVEMIQPYRGSVLDPCCGSGGMFIQSEKFIEAQGGRRDDFLVFGQESNRTTWCLCKMNLTIRGIDANIKWGDSFSNDQHKDLKVDYILTNPPFNAKDWKGDQLRQDIRWKYGVPPVRNANFAWVQHIIHHLSPTGVAGFILTNGSLSSTTSNEGNIRKSILEADLIDCIVTLPDKLFYNTGIPACLWIINRMKMNGNHKDRKKEVLFIDARNRGVVVDRIHKELTDTDIRLISETYLAWKRRSVEYRDVRGYCKSATINQIRDQNHILTPARYVGVPEEYEESDSFDKKVDDLTSELIEQFKRSKELAEIIEQNLGDLGYDI